MAKKKTAADGSRKGKSWVSHAVERFSHVKAQAFSDVDVFRDGTWSSLGVPSFDLEMDFLGFPSGIIEIRGESMSGKTTMAYQIISNAKRAYGERCLPMIFSAENRDNRPLAESMGAGIDDIPLVHPSTTEEMQNTLITLVNEGTAWAEDNDVEKPKFVFVLDSMGMLFSANEINKIISNADDRDEKSSNPGANAKANNQMLKAVKTYSQLHDVTLIVINRTYAKIGFMAKGRVSAGGTGITYLPTVRIELRRVKDIVLSGDDRPSGQTVEVKAIKNDYGSPRNKFNVDLMFGYGYTLSDGCIDFARERGIIEKYGWGWKSAVPGIEVGWKTKADMIELLATQDKRFRALTEFILAEAHDEVLVRRGLKEKG